MPFCGLAQTRGILVTGATYCKNLLCDPKPAFINPTLSWRRLFWRATVKRPRVWWSCIPTRFTAMCGGA